MSRCVVLVLALLGVGAIAGCGRDDAASSTAASTSPAPAEPSVSAMPMQPEADTDVALKRDIPLAQGTPANDQETNDAGQPSDERGNRERIAVLTPGGPLLVDAWISIHNRPHTEVFSAVVKRVLDAGDTDGDGRPTWTEWAANEEFLRGDLANVDPGNDRLINMWVERFDENRDDLIQPSEAAAWLGRDSGTSVRPLAVRSRRSYLPIPSLTSRVWQLLDADRDGRLSGDEIAVAPTRLWSLDADDDRMITPPELASLRDLLDAAAAPAMTPSFAENRHAAIHLEPPGDLDRLQYLLGDLYAPRQDLGPTSFPDLPGLFEALDANGDGSLERNELAELLSIKPHLEIFVAFADHSATGSPPARLRLGDYASEVVVAVQSAPNRVVVSLGNTRLIVSAHDLASGPDAQRRDLRLMVHDQCDALFEALDINADGRLGEREIATSPDRLVALDANQDQRLESDELQNCLIVAFLRGERPNEQSFYMPASPASPSVNSRAPPWFVRADFNGDGDVSRREFLGSIEQFSQLDANGDGFLSADEALEVGEESP